MEVPSQIIWLVFDERTLSCPSAFTVIAPTIGVPVQDVLMFTGTTKKSNVRSVAISLSVPEIVSTEPLMA